MRQSGNRAMKSGCRVKWGDCKDENSYNEKGFVKFSLIEDKKSHSDSWNSLALFDDSKP